MADVKDVKQYADAVTMFLGDRERIFQFDMNAFAELEKMFGSVEKAMDQLTEGRISDIRKILWAALIHDEVAEFDEVTGEPIRYNITPYQVGSWLKSPKMIQEASQKLAAAMGGGMPDPEDMPESVKAKLAEHGIDVKELSQALKGEAESKNA
ncbi:MAG: hypothetical protein GX664_03880 [Bacteroidales bacterium]|nr:hypothetical protein [Bacteroidales bacterium]